MKKYKIAITIILILVAVYSVVALIVDNMIYSVDSIYFISIIGNVMLFTLSMLLIATIYN